MLETRKPINDNWGKIGKKILILRLAHNNMNPKIISYGGMLNQSDFKQWYKYLKLRATYEYEVAEVSFLMSKAPFYFPDYERLETNAKITDDDQAVLSAIFPGHWSKQFDFYKDDFGTQEKRIVRVRQEETPTQIVYYIAIPWKIKDKDDASKLRVLEKKREIAIREENNLKSNIERVVDKLIRYGFFRAHRFALDIYHEVEERCKWTPQMRPRYVKEVLYQQVTSGNLTLKMCSGQLRYQEKKPDLHSP